MIYTLRPNKPITFASHAGVSFVKNRVAAVLGAERNPDVQFIQNCGIVWSCFFNGGVATVGGGSLTLSADGGFGVSIVKSNAVANGTVLRIDIDIISLDGDSKIEFYPGNNSNVVVFNTTGQQSGEVVVDGANYALYNTGLFDNSKLAVVNSLSIREILIPETEDEIASGPTTTIETSPATRLTYEDVSWTVEPILADITEIIYDSSVGNYQDDDGNPMPSQNFILTNCINPLPPRSITQTYFGPQNIGSGIIFDDLYTHGVGSGAPSGNELLLDQFLYTIDRGDLWGSNTVNPFVTNGPWDAAKAINVSGSSLGYLYTVPPSFIDNMTDSLPGIDTSQCLCVESIPGTGQTDFWLRTGSPIDEGGAVDTLPADIWIQFWMYQQNSGTQTGIVQSDKLIYPTKTNQTRPAEEMWLVDLRNQNFGWLGSGHQWYVAPNLSPPSQGYFQIEHGSSANTNFINWLGAAGDSWWKMQHHDASPPTPMIQNKWTLVRIHFDESGTTNPGGIGNISVRKYGDANFTQLIDLVHGQNIDGSVFNWSLPNNNGAAAISFFTTLTSNTFTFYKDIAIARGVNSGGNGASDLPTYTGY